MSTFKVVLMIATIFLIAAGAIGTITIVITAIAASFSFWYASLAGPTPVHDLELVANGMDLDVGQIRDLAGLELCHPAIFAADAVLADALL
ncbi:MAG: hypothetical protein ACR2Q4_07485 [Geminicoccaceae bacterium]